MARLKERSSLRGILVGLAVLGVLAVLAVTIGVGYRTAQVSRETDRVVQVYDPAAEDVATLSLANSDMQRGLAQFVLGGKEDDLRPYVDGERRSALALRSLSGSVADDRDIGPQLRLVQAARTDWIESVARPAIAQVRVGNPDLARSLVVGDESIAKYDRLALATDRLGTTINENRTAGFDLLQDLSQRLTTVVIITLLALIIAVLFAGWILVGWVLRPLNDLRRQIRAVASRGDHHRPITPVGPTELAAVARDAEAMRRQLVAEIDEASSARQSLAEDAPMVAAIRRGLEVPTDPQIPGLRVHGEVRPAETVLAGDWWDCIPLPSGEAALIVTDIAGHGPEAGVAAMQLKHLLASMLTGGADPDEAVTMAARSFSDDLSRFATGVVICVDPVDGRVRWVNAGHHPPLIVGPGGVRELSRTGPLLSWLDGPWQVGTTTLGLDEVLLAFSDGLVESHDAAGQQLDAAGLVALFSKASAENTPPDEAVRRTLAQARARAVDWDRDDVTLVALARKDSADLPNIPVPRPTPAPVR